MINKKSWKQHPGFSEFRLYRLDTFMAFLSSITRPGGKKNSPENHPSRKKRTRKNTYVPPPGKGDAVDAHCPVPRNRRRLRRPTDVRKEERTHALRSVADTSLFPPRPGSRSPAGV
ncbi:hypothetical protein GWI33_005303 [Rhynchophorus ferrugineus]|uniref:Uncharacterized protein n=1 Tax=Rhynchophorus ferrugineus TaxID=354439 RepID=A0A834IHQ3_RHYFE|nr:hypothetical protein GWI33_005303 [Rhynchophorus ferrugineus]